LYSLYINDAPAAPGIHLALFMDDTCIYMTEKHKHRVLCKLQCRLTEVNLWCEHWNIKINEGKTQAICYSRRLRVPDDVPQLNRQDIPFVNSVRYLGVTFDRRMTRRHHIKRTVAKALHTYVRTYSLFKSRSLSTNIKLALYKAVISSVMTSACPTWEYAADAHLLKLQRLQNRVLHTVGNLDRCILFHELHMAFKIPYMYDYITKLCRTWAELFLSNVNPNVCGIGQGEARRRKYKRLKVGGN
jgi:hypothetical protein